MSEQGRKSLLQVFVLEEQTIFSINNKMLGLLDPILFPDECEVYAMDNGIYVYPIFKNGSSSLRRDSRLIGADELSKVKTVDVFIRDPMDRYISGVQTYTRFADPAWDKETLLSIIDEFLFLNRHFITQFHWLMNFARQSSALIHIRNVNELSTVTDRTVNKSIRNEQLAQQYINNRKLQFYLQLDKVLYEDLMGKTVSFSEIVDHIKANYPELYTDTILRCKNICSVLG